MTIVTLTQACQVMAILRARVEYVAMRAWKVRSAARGANAQQGAKPTQQAEDEVAAWCGALEEVQRDLTDAQPQFAEILARIPAANDPSMHNTDDPFFA